MNIGNNEFQAKFEIIARMLYGERADDLLRKDEDGVYLDDRVGMNYISYLEGYRNGLNRLSPDSDEAS